MTDVVMELAEASGPALSGDEGGNGLLRREGVMSDAPP